MPPNLDARPQRRLDSAPLLATARRNDGDRRQQAIAPEPVIMPTASGRRLTGAMTAVIAGVDEPRVPRPESRLARTVRPHNRRVSLTEELFPAGLTAVSYDP